METNESVLIELESRSSLDLLTAGFYARNNNPERIIQILERRGFTKIIRLGIFFLLVPLIFVERFIADLGGDVWDDGSATTWKTIRFSILFS